jgi:hypothetical protein
VSAELPAATVAGLFESIGRVEAKVDNLGGLDNRLRAVELDVHTLKETQSQDRSRRAPWWVVVGVVFGAITAAGACIGLIITLSKIADALAASPLL